VLKLRYLVLSQVCRLNWSKIAWGKFVSRLSSQRERWWWSRSGSSLHRVSRRVRAQTDKRNLNKKPRDHKKKRNRELEYEKFRKHEVGKFIKFSMHKHRFLKYFLSKFGREYSKFLRFWKINIMNLLLIHYFNITNSPNFEVRFSFEFLRVA